MQIQDKITEIAAKTAKAIELSQNYLLSTQYSDGYWWAELESNVTITSEAILLHKIWKTDKNRPLDKAATYLRQQRVLTALGSYFMVMVAILAPLWKPTWGCDYWEFPLMILL